LKASIKKYSVLFKTLLVFFVMATLAAAGAEPPEPGKPAAARLPEIRLGLLAHDVGGLWSGTHKESGLDISAEVIFNRPRLVLLGGEMRPNFGLSANTAGNTSSLYAGFTWERTVVSNFFLDLGLGLALHNGKLETADAHRKQLGYSLLFRIPVEVGYALDRHHRISLMFAHMSNAYLADPNEGLDMVGIRYGYRF